MITHRSFALSVAATVVCMTVALAARPAAALPVVGLPFVMPAAGGNAAASPLLVPVRHHRHHWRHWHHRWSRAVPVYPEADPTKPVIPGIGAPASGSSEPPVGTPAPSPDPTPGAAGQPGRWLDPHPAGVH